MMTLISRLLFAPAKRHMLRCSPVAICAGSTRRERLGSPHNPGGWREATHLPASSDHVVAFGITPSQGRGAVKPEPGLHLHHTIDVGPADIHIDEPQHLCNNLVGLLHEWVYVIVRNPILGLEVCQKLLEADPGRVKLLIDIRVQPK